MIRRYKSGRFHEKVRTAKVKILAAALRRHDSNRTHTARYLGLQRAYLHRLIKTLGVEESAR